MSGSLVLLMRLSCRTSSKGTQYLSGFLGCARVVAFKAKEPDRFGNQQWELFVSEPQQRDPANRDAIILPTGETREYRGDPRDDEVPF
jgi:hypothetical protein